MKRWSSLLIIGAIFMLFIGGNASASINVDGDLEWINWDGVALFEEDTPPWQNYLGPGYGAQDFDVEFLALYNTGNRIYFGLQTGFDMHGPVMGFGPGDFAIDIDYDLEYEYAIDFSFSQGNDVSFDLVDVCTWRDVMYPSHSDANPFEYLTGDIIDNFTSIEYGFFCDSGGNHHILEGYLDASAFDLERFDCVGIRWTMGCGNDFGLVYDCPPVVPEPCTLFLLVSGVIGISVRKFINI